jgi:hypothetical protein
MCRWNFPKIADAGEGRGGEDLAASGFFLAEIDLEEHFYHIKER